MRIAIIDTSTSRAAIISDGLREAGLDDLVVIDAARLLVNDPVARFTKTLVRPVRADRSSVSVIRPP